MSFEWLTLDSLGRAAHDFFHKTGRARLSTLGPEGGDLQMTKSELIAQIAARNPHLYQRDVERIVTSIFEEISKALGRGDRVELRGFGAFSVKNRDARVGRNPRTGESVSVDEKAVPYFKTGKQLRDLLNNA